MSDIPHYRDQPATLDERVEIPEDAPLAQGHDEEKAADVREALADHKAAIEEAAESPEVGPGDPTQLPEGYEEEAPDDEVPDGSIDDVLAWVGDDHERAQAALDAENAKPTPRTSLVTKLESI